MFCLYNFVIQRKQSFNMNYGSIKKSLYIFNQKCCVLDWNELEVIFCINIITKLQHHKNVEMIQLILSSIMIGEQYPKQNTMVRWRQNRKHLLLTMFDMLAVFTKEHSGVGGPTFRLKNYKKDVLNGYINEPSKSKKKYLCGAMNNILWFEEDI